MVRTRENKQQNAKSKESQGSEQMEKEELLKQYQKSKEEKKDDKQDIESKELQNSEHIEHEGLIKETEQLEKEQKNQDKIQFINPDKLKPHPKNKEIYGDEPVDNELVESIIENGQLEPVVITKDPRDKKLYLISGHRRWKAIKHINENNKKINENIDDEEEKEQILEIKCFYRSYETDSQITEAIIEYNRQRKKVPSQIYKEAISLYDILSKKAKQRQVNPLKRGPVVPNLAQRGEDENEYGRTNEIISDSLGLGKETFRKLKFIGDVCFTNNSDGKKYENLQSNASDILDELDKGKLSYDAAFNKLKLICVSKEGLPESIYAAKLVNQIKNGEKIFENVTWENFENYCNSPKKTTKDDVPTNQRGVIPPGVYSVIITDLTKYDEKEAKECKFTEANNAALFLWATTFNIKERIDLLGKCNFTLKAIGIWKNEKSGIYFKGTVEFLLLGIRGIIKNSDFKPDIILNNGNTHDDIYEIAEKMFPNEKYIDMDKDPKREGWDHPYYENTTNLDQLVKNYKESGLKI